MSALGQRSDVDPRQHTREDASYREQVRDPRHILNPKVVIQNILRRNFRGLFSASQMAPRIAPELAEEHRDGVEF
jgi:hypothetical protein